MEIDLQTKSEELKQFVAQFETKRFVGDISTMMQFIRFDDPIDSLKGLSSPQMQLLYLIGLNLSSKATNKLKPNYDNEDFEHIKTLLNEIELGYEQFFVPDASKENDHDWFARRDVSMPTFFSYFNQGLLNYEEQIIERVERYFTPFNDDIIGAFGLSVQDFIDIFNFIDSIPNNFLMQKINKKPDQETFKEYSIRMKEKGKLPWDMSELPDHLRNHFEFMADQGKMLRYKKQDLVDKFGEIKALSFLNTFTCKREESNFLYYTEHNPVHSAPILNLNESEFQIIEPHLLIQAIFNVLQNFCTSGNLSESYYANRGKKLEEKIVEIFQRFYKNTAEIHKGYYTKKKHEQDVLVVHNGLALIIEAKASKRDEPYRDLEKAYRRIKSNFDECIQKGYDQALRVKSFFLKQEYLELYSDQKLENHQKSYRTKNFHHAFSIVVTLERFGQIQTDLSRLLNVDDYDDYPFSICIDDLEVFLLQLEKHNQKPFQLIKFLEARQNLHEIVLTGDELEVCGAFITSEKELIAASKQDDPLQLKPTQANIFDVTYQKEGLGFVNEKNLELKKDERYIPIGGY